MSKSIIDPKIPALSIRNPWAWLIANGHKDIENRDWPTKYRGWFYIHTGLKLDDGAALSIARIALDLPKPIEFPPTYEKGGIIGMAEIVDCVEQSDSPWFFGQYGFVIRNARPGDFIPCKGRLGFFHPEVANGQ